jgi:hypothetical protein
MLRHAVLSSFEKLLHNALTVCLNHSTPTFQKLAPSNWLWPVLSLECHFSEIRPESYVTHRLVDTVENGQRRDAGAVLPGAGGNALPHDVLGRAYRWAHDDR